MENDIFSILKAAGCVVYNSQSLTMHLDLDRIAQWILRAELAEEKLAAINPPEPIAELE